MADKAVKTFNSDSLFAPRIDGAAVVSDSGPKVLVTMTVNDDGSICLNIPVIDQSLVGTSKAGNAKVVFEIPDLALTFRSKNGTLAHWKGQVPYASITAMIR